MNTMTELESTSTTPFEDWEDWHGENEDSDGFVVTFQTMAHQLYESWWTQAIEHDGDLDLVETEDGMYKLDGDTDRRIEHDNFDTDEVPAPGIYEDDEDGCYTVIVPWDFLTFEMCQIWIEKLNEKHGTDFELVKPDIVKSNETDAKGENQ